MVNALLLVQSHLLASSIVARREANTIVSIVEYPLPGRAMCHRQEMYAKILKVYCALVGDSIIALL